MTNISIGRLLRTLKETELDLKPSASGNHYLHVMEVDGVTLEIPIDYDVDVLSHSEGDWETPPYTEYGFSNFTLADEPNIYTDIDIDVETLGEICDILTFKLETYGL